MTTIKLFLPGEIARMTLQVVANMIWFVVYVSCIDVCVDVEKINK